MDTSITIQDIQQLQREAGGVENDLRLRAIAAERRVMELEAQVEALIAEKAEAKRDSGSTG